MLLQLMHDIVGNSVAFFFGQFLAKSAHKFAHASGVRHPRGEENLWSELVCDPDLEKMLHRWHLKRDVQRAVRGGRTASAGSRGRKAKGT